MVFQTKIGDTWVMLEAETTGAFTKSDLEDRPDPLRALEKSFKMLADVAKAVSAEVESSVGQRGSAEVSFGIKVDSDGQVFVAKSIDDGQLKCVVRVGGS